MPSHTFTTTAAEKLSATDDTPYEALCIMWRTGNSASFQFGGEEAPSSNAAGGGGITMSQADNPYFWVPVRGVRLTQLYAAGAVGDVVDIMPYKQKGIMPGA